jgi:hypothetical protein
MKKQMLFCLMIIFFSILTAYNRTALGEANSPKWTVTETIKTVCESHFVNVCSFADLFRPTPLNPDARSEMYRILHDETQAKIWGRVVVYFGVIGQQEDVPKLAELIERNKGATIDQNMDALLLEIITAMSMLESRDIPGAGTFMDKLITPEYWKSLDIKYLRADTGPTSTVNIYAPEAIHCKNFSSDPSAKEKAQKICNGIQDPKLKTIYAYRVQTMCEKYDLFMNAKKTGDWTSYYGKHGMKEDAMVTTPTRKIGFVTQW